MCGIIGGVGNLTLPLRKAIWLMLKLDTIRGPHSTGVAVVDKNGKYTTYKSVGDPWAWQDHFKEDFNKGVAPHNTKLFLGHNRYATVGAVDCDNAHPFISENNKVVGVHNGTVGELSLGKLNLDYAKYGTDSEAIINSIAQEGLMETIATITGAWSLVYYDDNNETVNFLRNQERPMYLARVADGDAILWASCDWMIKVAAEEYGVGIGAIEELPVDKCMQIDMDANAKVLKGKYLDRVDTHRKEWEASKGKGRVPFSQPKKGEVSSGLYEELKGTLVGFFLDSHQDTGKQGSVLWGRTLDGDKKIRIPHMPDFSTEYLVNHGENYWYIGEVVFVSPSTSGDVVLSVAQHTVSQPISWTDHGLDVDRLYAGADVLYTWLHNECALAGKGPKDLEVDAPDFVLPNDYVDKGDIENEIVEVYWNGVLMDREYVLKYLQDGCANCAAQPDLEDIGNLTHIDGYGANFLCEDCSSNEFVRQMITTH